jgi:V/A-type H+-transporting ATPase subunit E
VAYQDLLHALEEDVARQADELRETAARDRVRMLDEAWSRAAAEREQALSRLRAELDAKRQRALAQASLRHAREVLMEKRRLLADLQTQTRAKLSSSKAPEVLARLIDELIPEVGDGPVELVVDPGQEQACSEHLRRAHPEILDRCTVRAAASPRGGVEAVLGARGVLDNSFPARLANAWPQLESRVATALFGAELHGAV